ncbi:MAG: hypothetical protein HRU34_19830 [Richelia sp.]|nr:hypothetical protein [Richelia sp.]CDN12977.1 hypothetical protein RintRC_4716 [Richelia intracellularis]
MLNKGNFSILLILVLVFIGFGDSFLPKPLSYASLQTRTTMNSIIVSLFPVWQPKVNPNRRTEEAIKQAKPGNTE